MRHAPWLKLVRVTPLRQWRQDLASVWPVVLGTAGGLGLGAATFFGFGGVIGLGLCLAGLGAALWLARDAAPEWVGAEAPESPWGEPLAMVDLEGRRFLMGSPPTDADALYAEKPRHKVAVAAFTISRCPITRGLYRHVCATTPAAWSAHADDDDLPATHVSWFDAVAFCNALSAQVDLKACYRLDGERVRWDRSANGYRLPTEAEWEYAGRAGTTSKWFFGDDPEELASYAWFVDNSDDRVHPVGTKTPNPWGLHDMSGNVWEWCWDWDGRYGFRRYLADWMRVLKWSRRERYRVLRGGAVWSGARDLRSADRDRGVSEVRNGGIGFRVVRRPRRKP